MIEREINSANDNPLVDPETGALYRAGNFYGGHIARLLDTWKLDCAVMANWANALMAVLVDPNLDHPLSRLTIYGGGALVFGMSVHLHSAREWESMALAAGFASARVSPLNFTVLGPISLCVECFC